MEIRDLFNLENDTTFQKLNQQVNSFNTLKILKLESHEIRHSNILAWLLHPKENHNLGDYFLRKMVEHLILTEENNDNPLNEKVADILNHSLMDSHVFREVKTDRNRFIDLVIVNQQAKTVFLIENKFYSTESKNQLDDYLEYINETFEGFTIIPIYLTLDGEAPSNEQYFILTYERIALILDSILLFKERLSEDVYTFLEHYHNLLNEKFYPNEDYIQQAIHIYRNHKEAIEVLFKETDQLHKQLNFTSGYQFEFMMKYKNTIKYIYKHGQNILSYSFEQFIKQQFEGDVLYKSKLTHPNLLPPEWNEIGRVQVREADYWLGKGIVVWFEQTKDNRLSMIAEIGPIEFQARLLLLEKLESVGLAIKNSSKLEKARYTRFYLGKMDINKWDDMAELTQAMMDLYNSAAFILLRKQVAAILNKEDLNVQDSAVVLEKTPLKEKNTLIQDAFKSWMQSKHIPETDYRISTRNLSFKIPLFDQFKEELGETREKWWWDNGPLLFWFEMRADSIYFTLEVGPIEADKRVTLMENMKEHGIKFQQKGLTLEAKYNRIHSETRSIVGLDEVELIDTFNALYENEALQEILRELEKIYGGRVI